MDVTASVNHSASSCACLATIPYHIISYLIIWQPALPSTMAATRSFNALPLACRAARAGAAAQAQHAGQRAVARQQDDR